jgi:hypothetical protein
MSLHNSSRTIHCQDLRTLRNGIILEKELEHTTVGRSGTQQGNLGVGMKKFDLVSLVCFCFLWVMLIVAVIRMTLSPFLIIKIPKSNESNMF